MLDLDTHLALPRLSGLATTAQGRVLVHVSAPDPAGTAFATALHEVDAEGGPSRQLTLPRKGAALAGVLPSGDLLLRVARPDPTAGPDAPDGEDEVAALWLLPAAGGEARCVVRAPAGIGAVAVARDAGTVVVVADVSPGTASLDEDRAHAERRKKGGVSALWFDSYPVRYWDHPLAPRDPRLMLADVSTGVLRDLTSAVGRALEHAEPVLTPDGSRVLTTWQRDLGRGRRCRDLVALDVASGQRTLLADAEEGEYDGVAVSPDGRLLAATWSPRTSPSEPARQELRLVRLDEPGSAPVRLAPELDRWLEHPVFTDDSAAVLATCADGGRHSAYRVPTDGGSPQRLSAQGAFSDLAPAPDGSVVWALRSTVGTPPEVVALDPHAPDQEPRPVLAMAPAEPWPGRVEEVHAQAEDGTALRAWLVVPAEHEGPVPLAVLIHGGPLGSWDAWSWRWQPQLWAARGYAVLLPDPALSVGYGQAMVERGWQEWGGTPYTDVLALTDAALERPDLDSARTAVLGGSYGGYLTNWVIGHTDRFRCAVTHASLWELIGFAATTDDSWAWTDWFGDPVERADFYREWSPATYADAISTPTLVVHGEQDHRVPVGEGLRLFTDLQRRGVGSALLYFPDENHWVLKPGNVRVWYDAVLGWLDRHLLDADWERPALA